MDWNLAVPVRSPCSRRHIYRPILRWPVNEMIQEMIQNRLGGKCCSHIKPKLSFLASTCLEEQKFWVNNIISTVEHGGGNIWIRGCLCAKGTEWPHRIEGPIDRCTSRMQISHSIKSLRTSFWLRSSDCGGHLRKVNLLSCSRNRQ